MAKTNPYAALKIKEFNIFLLMRFLLVFGWSMQFIVIEWQVYSITKDPLSLGIIGLMEIIPAFSMALFAGHIVNQKENSLRHLDFTYVLSSRAKFRNCTHKV